jgi:hypothetical protein
LVIVLRLTSESMTRRLMLLDVTCKHLSFQFNLLSLYLSDLREV